MSDVAAEAAACPEAGAPEAGAPEDAGIPWINTSIQQRLQWREGDVVISVPLEERHDVDDEHRPPAAVRWRRRLRRRVRRGSLAGVRAEPDGSVTTCSRLRSDGDRSVAGVQDPLRAHPKCRISRRIRTRGELLVVVRNPDEAVASMRPFIAGHSDAWFDLWQMPKDAIVGPDFATFLEAGQPHGGHGLRVRRRVVAPARRANVLFVHFSDLKREPEHRCDVSPTSSASPWPTRVGRRSWSTRRSIG